ncbi:TPA: hypothetical protein JH928_003651 [Acinetobacter baumannii]|nr:hypothetical protein [Acinetobacter baumannii]
MDKFEEVWKENRHVWESTKNLAKAMYLAGEEAQQAKVEEANAKAQMCRDEKNHAINRWSAVCKERDELQKRVDQQGLIIAKAMSIASDLQKSWSMFEIGKKLEQALKGEGQ